EAPLRSAWTVAEVSWPSAAFAALAAASFGQSLPPASTTVVKVPAAGPFIRVILRRAVFTREPSTSSGPAGQVAMAPYGKGRSSSASCQTTLDRLLLSISAGWTPP